MYDIIIFIRACGLNIREDNLIDTLESFKKRIGECNYGFFLSIEPSLCKAVYRSKIQDKIIELKINNTHLSWANDFNLFFDKYKNKTKWIMISHDDLTIENDNFFQKVESLVKGKEEKIGWITFSNEYYYRSESLPISCLGRGIFAKDRLNGPYLYECHNFTRRYWECADKHLSLLDYPKQGDLIKVHGVMSDLIMVTSDSLKKIGYCEDWSPYTMYIDEDWSIEALKNNLHNIWIPSIHRIHPLRKSIRVAGNRWINEANDGFKKKWGFNTPAYPDSVIEEVKDRFKGTLIEWSANRNTFDWELL